MILCVTPNPAIDRTLVVSEFDKGKIFRTDKVIVAPGGKGINVARAVHVLGGRAVCAGFLGGHTGRLIVDLMRVEGLPGAWTPIDQETRTCIIIADSETGQTTVLNEQGPMVSANDWARLESDLHEMAKEAICVCLSGSLPPGSPSAHYTDIIQMLCGTEKPVWVDTSGESLRAAVTVKGVGIKINNEEAAALLNLDIDNVHSARIAGETIREQGPQTVVLTMGARGAMVVHETGCWYAIPPEIQVASTVASGDCFLAGLVMGLTSGKPLPEALGQAVAAGAANALSVGGGQFRIDDYERILAQTRIEAL